MNNDEKMIEEMLEEMAIIISGSTELDTMNYYSARYKAKALIDEGYRRVADDEIVIKKDEHMDFLRICLNELKKHSEFIDGFSQGYKQAKQEIVKKILQELSDEGYKIYEQRGYTFDIGNFYWLIAYAKRKYEINLE